MHVQDWLQYATKQLTSVHIETARLDSLVLLEDTVQHDRAWLLAHPEALINPEQEARLTQHLSMRMQHIPLAYIRGKAEFYGRDFLVNQHVLVPRPESETIIDLVKKLAEPGDIIADIGTGSGALAVTTALELPNNKVVAVDIDPQCLEIAERNAARHQTTVAMHTGNLLEPFLHASSPPPTVLLCNLPYVPTDYPINAAATHEPAIALFAGSDGLDAFRTLFTQAEVLKPRLIITESLPEQHSALIKIATDRGYSHDVSDDFIQVFTLVA